ncbi:MAG TPA: ribonuclease III [Chloroflexota bacterium]|nr:ribonuclease III [Chloroflexota bacterium]
MVSGVTTCRLSFAPGNSSRGGSIDNVDRIERSLGIHFQNKSLLEQAFVHRSYLNENSSFPLKANERLEYLGDAVIGIIVSEYLYMTLPDATEGTLTTLRAALVRAQTLGRVARSLGLGQYLLISRGEIEAGGRTRRKLLAQTFEAVAGAIYLDQGYAVTRDFVLGHLKPDIDRIEHELPYTDAKSTLQVLAQRVTGIRPTYGVISETGPGHQPHFVVEVRLEDNVLGTGSGNNKRDAEQAAARIALENWPSTFPDRD